ARSGHRRRCVRGAGGRGGGVAMAAGAFGQRGVCCEFVVAGWTGGIDWVEVEKEVSSKSQLQAPEQFQAPKTKSALLKEEVLRPSRLNLNSDHFNLPRAICTYWSI